MYESESESQFESESESESEFESESESYNTIQHTDVPCAYEAHGRAVSVLDARW